MATKAGKAAKAAPGKVRGSGNRAVAATSKGGGAKRISGSTKQHPGAVVKRTPTTSQGQNGPAGPANKSAKRKGSKSGRGY